MSPSPSERAELIKIVHRIMTGDCTGDEEVDCLVADFRAAAPHPRAVDLIFWPHDEFDHDPSPEEVVDRAFAYRAIEL